MKKLNKKEWFSEYNRFIKDGNKLMIVKLVREKMTKKVENDYNAGLAKAKEVVDHWMNYPKVLWEYTQRGFYIETGKIELGISIVEDANLRFKHWERTVKLETLKETKQKARSNIKYFNNTLREGEDKRYYNSLRFRASRNGKPDLVIKL